MHIAACSRFSPAPLCSRLLSFLLVSALFIAPRALASAADPPRDVSEILESIRDDANLPALAAVVVERDSIVAQGVVGLRAADSSEAVTLDDKFHLGSCTKSMTATMLATLVEAGTLRWDTTIFDVFPEESKNWNQAWRAVTLEHLLAHRAGVPGNIAPALWAQCWRREGTPTEQRLMLAEALLREAPKCAPGEKFEYANAGFTIAGAMAERITGTPWETLMHERLFAPLNITSAGFGAPGSADSVDQPRGHVANKKLIGKDTWNPVAPGPAADNPPAIGPGGTAHMSLPDWAKYIAAHLVGERGGSTLLKADTFKQLHTAPHDWNYAWGWGITRRNWAAPADRTSRDGRVITHSGSNTMWYCVVWASPDREIAVLIATNAMGDDVRKACDDAASKLIADHEVQKVLRAAPPK